MTKQTFSTTLFRDDSMCYVEIPFDPQAVFGKIRAPVLVHLPNHTFPSTLYPTGGMICVPVRKSNREAAGLEGGETIEVTIELDTSVRDVEPPADLVKALKAAKVLAGWDALSFTHKREHAEAIEGAKKPETRTRRIAAAVKMIAEKAKSKTLSNHSTKKKKAATRAPSHFSTAATRKKPAKAKKK